MDHKPKGILWHCVLLLMLQWRPALPASLHAGCGAQLDKMKSLVSLLQLEAGELLAEYTKFHGVRDGRVPDDVPDPAVSGADVPEQLRDIHTKSVLFMLHVAKVAGYQKRVWNNSIAGTLGRVRGRLFHGAATMKTLLKIIKQGGPFATPPPLQLSHDHDFAKKEYGWGVLVRLKGWLERVSQALEGARGVCDESAAGARR